MPGRARDPLGRRPVAGRSLRAAHPSPSARLCRRRAADARAGVRGDHGHLHGDARRAVQARAVCRSCDAREGRRADERDRRLPMGRSLGLLLSKFSRLPARRSLARHGGLPLRRRDRQRSRRSGVRRRAAGVGQPDVGARRCADRGAQPAAGRRSAGRGAGRRHQSGAVAAPLWRRAVGGRRDGHVRGHALHDRRRGAGDLRRAWRRPPDADRAEHATLHAPSRRASRYQRVGAPSAWCDPRRRAGRARRRRSQSCRAISGIEREPRLHCRAAAAGCRRRAIDAVAADGRGGPRAVDRVRERREPAARARRVAGSRSRPARRPRRRPGTARASVSDRERRARDFGRHAGRRARRDRRAAVRAAMAGRAARGGSRSARLERPCVRPWCVPRLRISVRAGAGHCGRRHSGPTRHCARAAVRSPARDDCTASSSWPRSRSPWCCWSAPACWGGRSCGCHRSTPV